MKSSKLFAAKSTLFATLFAALSTALFATLFAAQLVPSNSWASSDHTKPHANTPVAAKTTGDAAGMSEGEVRKIDKDAKKITLKHGEIKNLEMPAMTMVFQVKDTTLLDKVKTGDKVRFKAEKVSSGYALTDIEVAK